MDKNKVAELAKSLCSSSKQVVKNHPFAQGLASPEVMLVAMTVFKLVTYDIVVDKRPGWGMK